MKIFRLKIDNWEEFNEYHPWYFSVLANTLDEAIDTLLAYENASYQKYHEEPYERYKRDEINLATQFEDHTREVTFPMVM